MVYSANAEALQELLGFLYARMLYPQQSGGTTGDRAPVQMRPKQ